MSRPATADEAKYFAAHMTEHFHARIVRKNDAVEMQVVANVLQLAGVVDAQEFLESFTTTIGPFIYLPDGMSPDSQIEVLVHECQHVHQWWTGLLGMAWLYLSEPEARVRFEAEAYRAGLELAHARGVELPSFSQLAMPLEHGYALSQDHIDLGRDLLEVAATSIVAGVVATPAAKEAISWIRLHAPELLKSSL